MEMAFFQSGAVVEAPKVPYEVGSGNPFISWKDLLL